MQVSGNKTCDGKIIADSLNDHVANAMRGSCSSGANTVGLRIPPVNIQCI